MHPSSNNIWPKSVLSAFSVCLILVVLCHFFPCQTAKIGDAACDKAAASEKLSCLQDQVRRTPADARTWFDLGKFYHEVGNIANAKISYHNVVKLYPLSYLAAEAHLHQGIIHQTDGAPHIHVHEPNSDQSMNLNRKRRQTICTFFLCRW
jgi:hypothetical protein